MSVEKVEQSQPEQVLIQCYRVTDEIDSIINFVKSIGASLAGYIEDSVTEIFLTDIFYVEAVENRVFAYTKNQTYQIKIKLYEFEEANKKRRFLRCSKSMIVNLMKIESVYPIFNGRFAAKLFNGEEIIISRSYVPALKKILSGGNEL